MAKKGNSFKWDLKDKTLNVWDLYFTHWTLVSRATYWDPAEYDDTEIEIDDYVNPEDVLFGDDFEIRGTYCNVYRDFGPRCEDFCKILVEYYTLRLQKQNVEDIDFWIDLLKDYLEEEDDADTLWGLIKDDFWENDELTEKLGKLVYDIVEESINEDENFQQRCDEDYSEDLEYDYAEARAEAREETAEERWLDALDRLDL